ncbi:type II toxin-antitoxin system HicB family antitoxin [Mesorhizobium sp.]|uniref:type II toxin-antitoxin system HicB family antitoxin n=1 Tax=Mesorhizobium sp. TaxID=1871066 RepID=UPI0025B93585|nr:type II toxin-antitoxin system HicB family antitoxin [Mesorhizobium sp.]
MSNPVFQYVGLIHKETESDYGVSFPDFPGVITAGATISETRALAKQALALHVAGIMEDGTPFRGPSSLDQVQASSDHSALTTILVPLQPIR